VERFLETVARGLCEQPGRVRVSASESGDELRLELKVAPSDRGRVIGKGGRTADALRALLQAAARASGRRVTLEIRA
jgi:hypothetical protein